MNPTMTVIIPTFNEAPNIHELLHRIAAATDPAETEIVVVDDSTDSTAAEVRRTAAELVCPVRLLVRPDPVGGLSGAVLEGFEAATGDWCVVMDGDLQHPPELLPALVATGRRAGADVVVASRYRSGGSNDGLAGSTRRITSLLATSAAKTMFPRALADCSDPMSGFFAVRRSAIDTSRLHPRGFKILLEVLALHRLSVAEEPFTFGERLAGESKATLQQGVSYFGQLLSLRMRSWRGIPAQPLTVEHQSA
ncbi:polyprenol monophosphomannose synthase [Leifsonia poae]|uniref:polyprenol monophosphomannose synthase n=1 Tax=Leifsonia poae TaxID=110933 RepID=UPI001CC0DA6D|nr:polyprenol monophosphomannose synthase [Leifsonia poae]